MRPCNAYACAQPQSPQGQEDGLAGDHEEQVNMRSEGGVVVGRQGKARQGEAEESKETRRSLLNPVEFLSSSSAAAPLGGVRSLWRERGKTGTVRNKAPNSHDMFS